ncbi:AAA family ATPase [Micromonospora sp. WP24]|uniref:adenylate/guanylate cyclase domain-containing protein n=1 Tax=Micromonospora sp. WP24 TaxID=2604469 RepID=UPI0011D3BADB|nr:adenylate/guanylate cyclase domain-containing protein [Micromonospora sp. WP24]TYB96687.1 AAA family ATPase [Micromonospora sp. WP24]
MSTSAAVAPRVPSARWPVPEERRTVTVLFVDIVGSTALVDRLDPEDVRAVQRAYFDTVAEVLRRWNGVVEKYVGDAVMALFGARESDGFDAYRALRAGLEIQPALDRRPLTDGVVLRVRVGVATGEAVVELPAARDGAHGVASGAVITTAARLQEYAPPGAVVCCPTTQRATAGLLSQRQLAPIAVPGRTPGMGIWRVAAPLGQPTARHDGPLVGRRRELATARDRIVQAVRERSPGWVSVTGPSGSGRSRLLHELTRALDVVDGVPVRWCVASCPPHPHESLAPVANLLRDLVGLRPTDPSSVLRGRLSAALTGLLPPARLATALPALERLLAVPDATAAASAAWLHEVLLRLAARRPLVLGVDDLDRAAPAVDRFLHALFTAASARKLPLAVVTLHGTDRADVLPVARGRRCHVPLRPLAAVQTGRLLRQLLVRAGQPVDRVAGLLPLVGDTPGHAVAYVHSLADGADPAEPPLPEALGRAVGAEVDRLDGTRRAALMAGATLPDGFTAGAVERLLDWAPGQARPALAALRAADLLVARPEGRYALATPALRRVAADRLPRRLRAVFASRATGQPESAHHGHVVRDAVGPAPCRVGTRPETQPARPARINPPSTGSFPVNSAPPASRLDTPTRRSDSRSAAEARPGEPAGDRRFPAERPVSPDRPAWWQPIPTSRDGRAGIWPDRSDPAAEAVAPPARSDTAAAGDSSTVTAETAAV